MVSMITVAYYTLGCKVNQYDGDKIRQGLHGYRQVKFAEAADLYRHVGVLGRVFVDIETRAFALPS